MFCDGTRVAIVGTLCHHFDMGGIAAGSYGATATEVFQEGLRIPPVKLFRRGVLNDELLAVMRQNVRRPDMLWGDLQAQIASLAVGEANLARLAARFGPATLVEACGKILDGSEAAMRATIARMPDGRYEFEDFLDDDGLSDTPIRIHAAVTVAGDEMIVDLSGSGPQALGPVNATLASAGSAVSYAVMACADTPIPANAGCYRPVRVVAREGSIVHARHPAPVANRVAVTHRLATTLLGALAQAVPDRVPAAYYGVSYVCTFQTIGEADERGVLVEIEVGGGGGHPAQDGLNGFASGMHNNANIPVEMIEGELPLTVSEYGILPDTAGAGRFRGGAGLVREWRVDCPEAVFTANLERFKFAPYGLAGGAPGALGKLFLTRDGERRALGSKIGNVRLRRGDVIRLETSGGGGFGDPVSRPAEEVAADLARGYVSSATTSEPFMRLLALSFAALLSAFSAARAEDAVKLGAFVTLSGVSADVGAQMKAGIEVAVDRIQKDYAVAGKPTKIEVIYYDDEGKADTGLNVVTRALTVDHINVGIGFLSSDVYIRVIDEFQRASTPVLACCSASLKIGDKIAAEKMNYVFQLSPTARDIATAVAGAVATLVKPDKVAMLNENTDAGRDFSRISREWLAANAPKVEVAADEFVPHGVSDLTPQLAKFKRLGVGAILGEVYGASAPVYYQQFNELRVPAVIAHMGTSASADSFVAEHGAEMEGSLVNVRWIPGDYTPVSRPMMDAYKAKMGSSPSTFAVQAHDSALVALEAICVAGTTDPAKVAQVMEEKTFVAAWGERHFSPLAEGHRMPVPTIVTQIQDGKKVVVYPAEIATGQGGAYRAVPPYSWQK